MVAALKLFAAVGVVGVGSAAVVHLRVRHPRTTTPAVAQTSGVSPAPAAQPDPSLLEEAAKAYVAGQYEHAIDLARRNLDQGDSSQKNWRVIGAASCFLHDGAGAEEASQQLDAPGRQFIEHACGRNGTPLPQGKRVM